MIDELPVSTAEAQRVLRCGRTRMSAIKRAMGIRGHQVFVGAVVKWLKAHPGFVESEIYPRKRSQRAARAPRKSSTQTR